MKGQQVRHGNIFSLSEAPSHNGWQQRIRKEDAGYMRSLRDGISTGRVNQIPISANSPLSNKQGADYIKDSILMNMKNAPEGARKFPIRNIFGSARNEAAPYFYSTKSLNPADAAQCTNWKPIHYPTTVNMMMENRQQKRQTDKVPLGKRVYEGGHKLGYMSDNIDLSQPSYQKVSVTNPISPRPEEEKLNPIIPSRAQSMSPNQMIGKYGRTDEFSAQPSILRQSGVSQMFLNRKDLSYKYDDIIRDRVQMKDVLSQGQFPMSSSNRTYGNYRHPQKYVKPPPMDSMSAILASSKVGDLSTSTNRNPSFYFTNQ